jgi:hypothetical protein
MISEQVIVAIVVTPNEQYFQLFHGENKLHSQK